MSHLIPICSQSSPTFRRPIPPSPLVSMTTWQLLLHLFCSYKYYARYSVETLDVDFICVKTCHMLYSTETPFANIHNNIYTWFHEHSTKFMLEECMYWYQPNQNTVVGDSVLNINLFYFHSIFSPVCLSLRNTKIRDHQESIHLRNVCLMSTKSKHSRVKISTQSFLLSF